MGIADCAFKLARALLEAGRYGEAVALTNVGVAAAHGAKHPHVLFLNLLVQGMAQRLVLDLPAARATQEQALQMQLAGTALIFPDWPLAELCAIAAQMADWSAAYGYARRALAARNDALLPIALTSWFEIEALLHAGDEALARAEVARLAQVVGDNPRDQIPYRRAQAVLAQWAGDHEQAIRHWAAAHTLAAQLSLPGEQWPILAAMATLVDATGQRAQATQLRQQAARLVDQLAQTIADEEAQVRLVAAVRRQSAR